MTGTTVLLSADAESYWAKDEQARMAERLSALGLALMTSGLEPVREEHGRRAAQEAPTNFPRPPKSAAMRRALRKLRAARSNSAKGQFSSTGTFDLEILDDGHPLVGSLHGKRVFSPTRGKTVARRFAGN